MDQHWCATAASRARLAAPSLRLEGVRPHIDSLRLAHEPAAPALLPLLLGRPPTPSLMAVHQVPQRGLQAPSASGKVFTRLLFEFPGGVSVRRRQFAKHPRVGERCANGVC